MNKVAFNLALGADLKDIRQSRNMSMSYVGEHLGVSRQAINSYESGRVPLTVAQLVQLCDIYGVHIGDVVERTNIRRYINESLNNE